MLKIQQKNIIIYSTISSIKYDWLKWLDRCSSWLKLWNTKTEKQGHLIKETSTALIHTVYTLVLLVKYLLQHHKLRFVLFGKFQSDNLEARFGQYRMLSGSNYLVSVNEVLQREKKLKVHSLLNCTPTHRVSSESKISSWNLVSHQVENMMNIK